MKRVHRKPSLVALDFRIGRAHRYVPKPIGGFYREEACISGEPGRPVTVGFGSDDGRALIEDFRVGAKVGQVPDALLADQVA